MSDAKRESEALELFERARPDTARRSRNESQRGETQLRHSSGEVEEAFVDGYLAGAESAARKAEESLLVKACDWLAKRGFADAATDLLCNWNDPGNPGDGSCRALHEQFPAPPQPKEEP